MTDYTLNLFFDVGDTLMTPRAPLHTLYADVIRRIKQHPLDEILLQEAMVESTYRHNLEMEGHFRYSDGWFKGYIHSLLEDISCPKPWNGIADSLLKLFEEPDTFRIFPDVRDCLQSIKAMGLKTAIVSNWGYRLSRLLEKMGLLQYFDLCISSAEVRLEKPNPEIFQLALNGLECRADQTVHIGDCSENDIAGGQSAGLHTVLIDREMEEDTCEETISSLETLIPHLRNRGLLQKD